MISQRTIQEILAIARADEVIDDFVQLKRRGVNLIGLCPFHNEKTPSFTVSPSKNLWKCFGCQKAGDAVGFLKEHEKLSYPEALRYLAKKYNITIEETESVVQNPEEALKKESLLLINEHAKNFFTDQLLQSEEGKSIGLSYFKHRGLNLATIEKFDLGYAPRGGDQLYNSLLLQQFNIDWAQEIGLVSASKRDFYRERVIFPFHSLSGRIIGFGGRILTNDKKSPKYLNSPESEIYNKRNTLYGLFQARNAIKVEGFCILVEGYTDVLSLAQNDVENVVASSGTALTQEQVRLIRRFTTDITVLYDGDTAGQKAAQRGLEIFLENGMNVKILQLPPEDDPDSYIKKIGPVAFKNALISESRDFIVLLAENIKTNYANDPINRSAQIRELCSSVAKVIDPLKRSVYIQECSRRLDLNEEGLIREVNRNIHQYLKKKKSEDGSTATINNEDKYPIERTRPDHSQVQIGFTDPLTVQERDICRILIMHGEKMVEEDSALNVAEYIVQNLNQLTQYFTDTLSEKILKVSKDKLADQSFSQLIYLHHDDPEISEFATAILMEKYTYANWSERGIELQTQKIYSENFVKDSMQSILRLKLRLIQQKIKELLIRISHASDDQTKLILITVHTQLLEERAKLATQLGVITTL